MKADGFCDYHQIIRIANSLLEIEVKEVSHTQREVLPAVLLVGDY